MSLIEGRIIKNYNGFYYVEVNKDEVLSCKVKGKMKKNRFSLVTGDLVTVEANGTEGMITQVLPRRNFLQRPAMANLDLAILTFACVNPDFSFLLLDKLIILAEHANIPLVICLNKIDLAQENFVEQIKAIYATAGYQVFAISALHEQDIEELREVVSGKVAVFAGPSGVGKSTTLNAIDPNLSLQTGAVSEKIGRGKHTTRFAQLLHFAGGYVVDTPGFGNLDFQELEVGDLATLFKEFLHWSQDCRFNGCSHTHEPDCAVKAALARGEIAASRYESYLNILEEIKQRKR